MRGLLLRLRERFSPADRWAIAVLVVLPVLLDVPWAIAGHPVLLNDNLTQNYPLRVLAGELIRHGQLPLWNPDIWSGTPLLAGWNAGAMFPGTWLFAVLPGVAAFELNMVGAAVIAGVGMHLFLRRIGCSPLASLLGALTFTYVGFMGGQSDHLGLYQGVAFAPLMLLSLDWLVRSRAVRFTDTAMPIALLGVSAGLVVLTGDPRAISNDAIVVGIYLIACCIRAERTRRAYDRGPAADRQAPQPTGTWRLISSVAAAAVLGAAISAVQWLPGLAYLHQSQRSVGSLQAFGAGSLHWGDLGYLLVQYAYGGNGNFHMPVFAGAFNMPELSYAVGLLPLVALCVLTVRAFRRKGSGTRVWLVMFVVGAVLASGDNTPLGHVLVHIPLYGGERLQNRNAGISDLALSVLLAIFLDYLQQVVGTRPARDVVPSDSPPGLPLAERLAGLVPPVLAVGLIAAMYLAPVGTEQLLGASTLSSSLPLHMTPYYLVVIAIAVAIAALLLLLRGLSRPQVRTAAAAIAVVELAVFLLMASYEPAAPSVLAASNPPAAAFGRVAGEPFGRTAIFNPQQQRVAGDGELLGELGLNDLTILRHFVSVEGYGSAVSSRYEAATATHDVENLRPSSLLGSTYDVLDLRALATLPDLIGHVEPSGAAPLPSGPPRPAGTSAVDREANDEVDFAPFPPSGPWRLGAGLRTDFVVPGPLVFDSVVLRFEPAYGALPVSVTVTARLRYGERLAWHARVTGPTMVVAVPSGSVRSGGGAVGLAVEAAAGLHSASAPVLGAVALHVLPHGSADLTTAGPPEHPAWFALDGILQGLLQPDHWAFARDIGAAAVFENLRADGPAWLEAPGATLPDGRHVPGRVTALAVSEWQAPTELVTTPRPALLVRSEQYATGWSATIEPAGGGGSSPGTAAVSLPVSEVGLVQGVELPAGRWRVTWHYASRRADAGLALGLAGVIAAIWLVVLGARRRKARRQAAGQPG
jgi:hypothetical protein